MYIYKFIYVHISSSYLFQAYLQLRTSNSNFFAFDHDDDTITKQLNSKLVRLIINISLIGFTYFQGLFYIFQVYILYKYGRE